MTDREVHVVFTVDAATDNDARDAVSARLDDSRPQGPREPGAASSARVRGWMMDEELVPEVWWRLGETPILQIVGEMFPPEPHPDQFRLPDGGPDEDGFEDAHEQWREECLSLAFDAAAMPELRARLERAERVRDEIADVLARYPLPQRPRRKGFPERFFGARVDEQAYAREYANWQAKLQQTVITRETALERILTEDTAPATHPPSRAHPAALPADLVAITALRTLLNADPNRIGGQLDQSTRQRLEATLLAADPDVHIPDPDTPDGVPIYEGPASEAHRWIVPGVYEATGMDGQGQFRVIVGRTQIGEEPTASAAFPPAGHDSTVLDQIARVLEDAGGEDREVDDPVPMDTDPRTVLARIDTLVAATGRATGDRETLIERAGLLSELLAEREKRVDPGRDIDSPPRRPDNPDLSR